MRSVLLLLAMTLAPAAFAQSGRGEVSGAVLPRSATAIGGFGTWDAAVDSSRVPTVTLTPVRTLVCAPGNRKGRCAPRVLVAHGLYGRYASGPLPMGEYRMRVSAYGCTSVTRTLVILSDSQSVEHAALDCTASN